MWYNLHLNSMMIAYNIIWSERVMSWSSWWWSNKGHLFIIIIIIFSIQKRNDKNKTWSFNCKTWRTKIFCVCVWCVHMINQFFFSFFFLLQVDRSWTTTTTTKKIRNSKKKFQDSKSIWKINCFFLQCQKIKTFLTNSQPEWI